MSQKDKPSVKFPSAGNAHPGINQQFQVAAHGGGGTIIQIACRLGQLDAATREISSNAQSAAQGNETLVANIGALSSTIGETSKAATSVLSASSDLTSTAETLSREVDKFFRNLRTDPHDRQGDGARRTGTAS